MTIIALPLPCSSSRDFLPHNFNEASQYDPSSSIGVTRSYGLTLTPSAAPETVPLRIRKPRARKFLRTITTLFHEDRRMSHAKIDLSTGELLKHDYKEFFYRKPKFQSNQLASDTAPIWMRMPAAIRATITGAEHDSSHCKRINPVKMYLDGYLCLSDAAEDLPQLRDAIESAILLDLGGNTRPLNSRLLFRMLQHLDLITPQTVMEFMGCGIRHAQKVAGCLRIIVNAFEKIADGKLSTATYKTPPKKRPCGSEAGVSNSWAR